LSVGGDYFHSPGEACNPNVTGYDVGVGFGVAPGGEVHWGPNEHTSDSLFGW